MSDEIIPLVKQKIPTIVGVDPITRANTIGDAARRIGLNGRTTAFNFKPTFGQGDKEFSANKKYWYWIPETSEHKQQVETFTAKTAGQRFFQVLLSGIEKPEKLIIGEPAIRDQAWKENFRKHIRELFAGMNLAEPSFFPEPFAVFQYYRHVEKILPVANRPEIVLIIDIGGGTFNSCIIRTTEQGLLARGGVTALPLGLQADVCGGSQIDKELLKKLVSKCQNRGIRWKEDPIRRIEFTEGPALLRIEDAKIQLSEQIAQIEKGRLSDDFSSVSVSVVFPLSELHPEFDIRERLTGEDLKAVIRDMWRRHYGKILCDTVNEAQEKLQSAQLPSFDVIDRVLIAGGSSRLPFIKEEVMLVLPNLVHEENIYIGSDIGEAVAFGIACECREQSKRDPKLSVDKISPCILNDLYLAFKRNRRDNFQIPRIRYNGVTYDNGQLLASPFETTEVTHTYEIELPFNIDDRLFYFFSYAPFSDDPGTTPLNLSHDVFSLNKVKNASRKGTLTLHVGPNGIIKPSFVFSGKGNQLNKKGETVECPEFFFEGFQIKEGKKYLGLDFGNSNSYLVQFASISKPISVSEYPQFTLRNNVKENLRALEIKLQQLRDTGKLTHTRIIEHARNQMLEVIFHSNKLEGNPLSKGETVDLLSENHERRLTEKELEAKNLETAYKWMLENVDECLIAPEAFIRYVNGVIMKGINSQAGDYRKTPISLAGMDFVPPPGTSVPAFMRQLSDEIKTGGTGRSPLEYAASMHTKLVWIHPFIDGNGRTARLLLNASLLAQNLPVIVINYADRERYLHCLSESNKGDLSSLVVFMIDCFEQQLAEFSEPSETVVEREEVVISVMQSAAESDPIVAALEEAGVADSEDPLAQIMKTKVVQQQRTIEVEYEAWQRSVLTIPAELETVIESFNSTEDYARAGYRMRLHTYDLMTIEKYADVAIGKSVTKTWFVGLDMYGPNGREKLLLFFSTASWTLTRQAQASRVSLVISRFDGTRSQRLNSEPITLREIGYRQGTLLFVSRERKVSEGSIRGALKNFLAEIIKSYL